MAEYADEAHRIVDIAIESACKRLREEPSLQEKGNKSNRNGSGEGTAALSEDVDLVGNDARNEYLDKLGKIDSKTFADIPNITWMAIGDFTVDSGLKKIEQFIEVCITTY